jgi:hypothetical protein
MNLARPRTICFLPIGIPVEARHLLRIVLFASFISLSIAAAQAGSAGPAHDNIAIFASPAGQISNTGLDYGSPVTLRGAQMLARRFIEKGYATTVYLEAGSYRMSAPLILRAEDSGLSDSAPTVYRAAVDKTGRLERVALVGSRPISGPWQSVDAKIFKTYVGKASEGTTFRQVYIDGERGTRAKSNLMPDGGLVEANDALTGGTRPRATADSSGFQLTVPLHVSDPTKIRDIEVVSFEDWASVRCPIESLSADGMTFALQQPCWRFALEQPPYRHSPRITWFENALEFVQHPGDWYHDRADGFLYYYPRDPIELTKGVEIPVAESLIVIRGSANAAVRNIKIIGITFEYTNWTGPERSAGYRAVQAGIISVPCLTCQKRDKTAAAIPGAIDVADAEGVEIKDNLFRFLGGSAVHLASSVRNAVVVSNDIHDVAGGGVFVGGWILRPPPKNGNIYPDCEHNLIANNTIRSTGLDYPDTVGIFVGVCRHVRVENNSLSDLPSTGISVGWGFSYDANAAIGGNRIFRNRIENVMGVTVDGGGIYTLGNQIDPASAAGSENETAGTRIEENFVRNVRFGLMVGDSFAVRLNMRTPAVAIYLDHGSSNIAVVNNVYDLIPQELTGLTPPLFGPQDLTFRRNGYESPCGYRACAIQLYGNHQFDNRDPDDRALFENSGARTRASALFTDSNAPASR